MGLVADPTPKERVQRSTVLRVEPLDQGWSWVRHGRLEFPNYIEPPERQFGNPQRVGHTHSPEAGDSGVQIRHPRALYLMSPSETAHKRLLVG